MVTIHMITLDIVMAAFTIKKTREENTSVSNKNLRCEHDLLILL